MGLPRRDAAAPLGQMLSRELLPARMGLPRRHAAAPLRGLMPALIGPPRRDPAAPLGQRLPPGPLPIVLKFLLREPLPARMGA